MVTMTPTKRLKAKLVIWRCCSDCSEARLQVVLHSASKVGEIWLRLFLRHRR